MVHRGRSRNGKFEFLDILDERPKFVWLGERLKYERIDERRVLISERHPENDSKDLQVGNTVYEVESKVSMALNNVIVSIYDTHSEIK